MRRCMLAVALLVVLLADAAGAGPRFHGRRVYVASKACTGHTYRPRQIILACGDAGFYATGVAYRVYGDRTAVASAQLHVHNCVPNCAQSAFHAYPGKLTLLAVVRCSDGRLYYSRARYRFAGVNPYGPSSGSANIEPFIHCSKALG
jgi:hypothetical protein